ncbi:hypothetical protein C8T65DRAFT_744039 [Cerioporus squamosus]|nr:hypothetical protein C8T65DRAFT_744039 [Cerioporus squamosus]
MQEASTSATGDHARKDVEDQIEVHARAITDLKTRLNTMTPVARLPSELLSAVFTLVTADSFVESYDTWELVPTKRANTWVGVTHVCRHWRATALSSPRFWSYIAVTSKRAADVMLVRSKQAPLHVVASVPTYGGDRQKAVKEVMANFARIRTLQLAGSSEAICDLFKMKLELGHVIPRAPPGPPSRKISLPHLSFLRVIAGGAECTVFLHHLTLPSDVRYRILAERGSQESADRGSANLFFALQTHLSSSPPMRTACFDDWGGQLSLHGWRAELQHITLPNPCERDSGEERADLELEVSTGVMDPGMSSLLRTSTIFTAVTHLDSRLDVVEGSVYRWRWSEVFAGMPNIRCLSVSRHQTTELPEALSPTDGDDPMALALPHLEVLKLTTIRLHSRHYNRPPEFLDVMIDALITRCNCGTPVQELHIKTCANTCRKDVDRLAEIVPEVHWDGACMADEHEFLEELVEAGSDEEELADYDYDYEDDDDDEHDADPGDVMFDDDGWY